MNIKYKIDRDTVFITDENGVVRQMPNYQETEEILKLENEIVVIDELIEASQNVINQNKSKKCYIHMHKWKIMPNLAAIAYLASMVGEGVSLLGVALTFTLGLINPLLFKIFLGVFWLGIVDIALMYYPRKLHDKVTPLEQKNEVLHSKISWLEKFKKVKENKIEKAKEIMHYKAQQEGKLVPIRQLTPADRLREMANAMDNGDNAFDDNVPIKKIDTILKEIEETTKQKVLKMR